MNAANATLTEYITQVSVFGGDGDKKDSQDIASMTKEQYFNNVDLVRSRAVAAGLKGEEFEKYHTTKGMYNGKKSTKNKPLDNGDLFRFGKEDHRKAVAAAVASGKNVSAEVLKDYPDLSIATPNANPTL